jgi:hypothetical protein
MNISHKELNYKIQQHHSEIIFSNIHNMFQPYQVIIRCDGYMNLELLQLKTIS